MGGEPISKRLIKYIPVKFYRSLMLRMSLEALFGIISSSLRVVNAMKALRSLGGWLVLLQCSIQSIASV